MFRLRRDVRLGIDLTADHPAAVAGRNGYAGKPPVVGIGHCYYTLAVTVAGEPGPQGYLVNIKEIDHAVRTLCVGLVTRAVRSACHDGVGRGGALVVRDCFDVLRDAFPRDALPPLALDAVELQLSPHTALATTAAHREADVTLLHHTFEFAASHRLHDASLTDAENRKVFGKCNNPYGHGHNYTVRVTVRGEADDHGFVFDLPTLERVVDETVIGHFDHKHLNAEVEEFGEAGGAGGDGSLNPSVENIAKVIYRRLAEPLRGETARLDSVTVWETSKTSCEYRE